MEVFMMSINQVPNGYYYYTHGEKIDNKYIEFGICLYWCEDETREEQERGYCSYIQKGDWDINKETGKQISFLWDKVKTDSCPKR